MIDRTRENGEWVESTVVYNGKTIPSITLVHNSPVVGCPCVQCKEYRFAALVAEETVRKLRKGRAN